MANFSVFFKDWGTNGDQRIGFRLLSFGMSQKWEELITLYFLVA